MMDFDKLYNQAARDQNQAANDALAWFLADRLRALRTAGIPEHVALTMIRDMNRITLIKGCWPDTPPALCGGHDT